MQHVYRHVVRAVTGFSFTMQHHCDTCHEREPCEASDCHVGCQLATDCDSLCKHCSSTANTKTTETILLGCPSLRLLLLRRLLGPLRNLRAMLPSCFGQSLHRDGGVRLGALYASSWKRMSDVRLLPGKGQEETLRLRFDTSVKQSV